MIYGEYSRADKDFLEHKICDKTVGMVSRPFAIERIILYLSLMMRPLPHGIARFIHRSQHADPKLVLIVVEYW